jgi:hypothetical protein
MMLSLQVPRLLCAGIGRIGGNCHVVGHFRKARGGRFATSAPVDHQIGILFPVIKFTAKFTALS